MSWTRNDVLIVLVAGGIDLAALLASHAHTGRAGTAAALTVAAALCLLARRGHPLPMLGGVLALQLASGVLAPMPDTFGATTTVALYTVVRHFPRRRTVVIADACTLAVYLIRAAQGSDPYLQRALADAMAVALVTAAGIGVRNWQRQADLNRRLLADRAVAEERRRIARELHDIVAHHITTMYLMSGGARTTLDTDPDTAREALVTLEESGRTALSEMRQLLGVLRSTDQDGAEEAEPAEPQPGIDDVARLVAEANAAGQRTEFEVTGERCALPQTVGLAVYRVVQEALSNVRKHAGQARTVVRLEYGPDRVAAEVVNDRAGDGGRGAVARGGAVQGGYGLLGMRERMAVHGGTLEAGAVEDGGFRVAASVPLSPRDHGRRGHERRETG
ncbi:sensor histidine kinase [Streptomyces sp. NPDC048172]|uniref:sensor histidine kinase n=1 Tax=Streptomyces sp. NPDC048172 TaxID=3365505 RepID=UPI00371EC773